MVKAKHSSIRTLLLLLLCLIWVTTGCQTTQIQQSSPKSQPNDPSSYQKVGFKPTLSTQSERIAEKVKGVDDSVAVVIDEDITVALKVTGFDRLRLKNIKKQVHSQVKKEIEGSYTIHITTDKKIYRNLESLHDQLIQGNQPPKDWKKRFKKINEDMHG